MSREIILPGDPVFDFTLATAIPPGWRELANQGGEQVAFIASADSGILRPATWQETTEYLYGGEYDERLEAIDSDEDGDSELVTFS